MNIKSFTNAAALNLSDEILSIHIEDFARKVAVYIAYIITAVVYTMEKGQQVRETIQGLVRDYETQWVGNPFEETNTMEVSK
ncbi:hypothetical protein [Synechococcus sp. MVIR-18-1]|uniref:hypothetical protein n=1 Tax=Synechococcus sp. MVIR-18-1 TaxID=1386941 RepID=UPI001648917E|nr:hypothetical protein [Synechococcus sp. MVIR-18-1]QNI75620.1 hypothetical protein SynMVIR181_00620 [Synechococcus sp. MVIR-18-1]